MSDEILFEAPRARGERLRVTRNDYKGKTFIHVRLYYEAENGEIKPSNKGIALRADEVEAVATALLGSKLNGGA